MLTFFKLIRRARNDLSYFLSQKYLCFANTNTNRNNIEIRVNILTVTVILTSNFIYYPMDNFVTSILYYNSI